MVVYLTSIFGVYDGAIHVVVKLQSWTKDLAGTLLHFWGVYQFTHAQPSPHPTNNVGCVYSDFFASFNFI